VLNIELTRVLIGVVILLFIALLPVRKDSGSRRAFLGVALGIFIPLALANLVFYLGDFQLDNPDEGVIKAQIETMQADQAKGIPKNLVIIEGSSQTALGVDGASIERELRQAGYDTTVVTLAGLGGNHLERYKLLTRWAKEVKRHHLALSPNTRLLLEVAPGYDNNPMRFIDRNKDTLRAYYYATLPNVVYTMQSMHVINKLYDDTAIEEFTDVTADALMSSLKIGLLPYMRRFDGVDPISAFAPARTGVYKMKPYDPEHFVKTPPLPLDPIWTDFSTFRAHKMAVAVGDSITEVDYFSVPVMPRQDKALEYAHSFCAWRKPAPCIDSTDPAIYGAVDAPQYHYNRDHLSKSGAAVYSHYFAQQLIAQGVVVK